MSLTIIKQFLSLYAGRSSPDGPGRAGEPGVGATVHPVLTTGRDQTGESRRDIQNTLKESQNNEGNVLKSTFVYQFNISQCDAESNYLEQQYFSSQQQQHLPPAGSSTSSLPGGGVVYHPAPPAGPPGGGGAGQHQQPLGGSSGPNQIDVVLSEVGH